MSIKAIDVLKTYFETGDKPTQQQFWDFLDSYFHKNDGIAMENVAGLVAALNGKADVTALALYALKSMGMVMAANTTALAAISPNNTGFVVVRGTGIFASFAEDSVPADVTETYPGFIDGKLWGKILSVSAGSTPDLQAVTTVGDTTDKSIMVTGNSRHVRVQSADGQKAAQVEVDASGKPLLLLSKGAGEVRGELRADNQVDSHQWQLPDKTGTVALIEDLNLINPVDVSASFTLAVTDNGKTFLADTSAGELVVTLPAAPDDEMKNRVYNFIQKSNAHAISFVVSDATPIHSLNGASKSGGLDAVVSVVFIPANGWQLFGALEETGGFSIKGEYANNTAAVADGLLPGDVYNIPLTDDKALLAVVKEIPPAPFWDLGIEVESGDLSFVIQDFNPDSFVIDWGDGTSDTYDSGTGGFAFHSYAEAGEYTVRMSGSVIDGRIMVEPFHPEKVKSTSAINGITGFTNLSDLFKDCTGITSIPAGLFDNCPLVTDFTNVFQGCTGITSIPAGLFDSCPLVTDFTNVFQGCTGITSIPTGLFDNCPLVTDFTSIFYGCTGITSIPAGLFDNNTAAENFTTAFYGCTGITSIPTGLFDNNTAANVFQQTFGDCTGITSIPAGLFDNNTAVENFYAAFQGCTGITSVPAGLFDNNTAVNTFQEAFYGCTGITSNVPELWIPYNSTVHDACFAGCTSALNYSSIPSDWK